MNAIGILREFVADVEAVHDWAREEWPDLIVTYRKAKGLLDDPVETQVANAALIAVNGELLKACKARLEEWHGDNRNFYRKEPASLELMRKAIATAERGI